MFGIFFATRRQGFIGGLLSSGGWILPVTGIGFAGLFREEIAEMRNDITSKKISRIIITVYYFNCNKRMRLNFLKLFFDVS